jgi:hypothetical protein
MAVSTTSLLQFLEWKLGFQFSDLELKHDEIINIIRSYTLPTFSKYFPYQERIPISKAQLVPNFLNRYFLPTEREVLNINRVVGTGLYGYSDAIIGGTPNPSLSQGGGNPLDMQMMADMASMVNPTTYQYIHPGMIEFAPNYGSVNNGYIIVANVVHDESLLTIPTNMQEYFMELAECDVKTALYAMRSRFTNLQTSYGALELNLDDLAEGKDRRDDLIERFKNSSLKTGRRKKLFIG